MPTMLDPEDGLLSRCLRGVRGSLRAHLTKAGPAIVREGLEEFCPHKPWLKQKIFLSLECEEAFYGGAAGGGKSDTLLMAALQYAHVPGYSALILRRDFARLALAGAIMDRAKAWLHNTSARWNDQRKTFSFPSGASLQFGFIDNPQDRFRYASSEYQFIGWDELTEFQLTEDESNPYLFMFSRLRAANGLPVPLRVRSASNPGNIGHAWVKKRFLPENEYDPAADVVDGPEGRKFVPARIADNPSINEQSYRAKLQNLPPVTRDRLMHGDWQVAESLAIPTSWLTRYTMRGEHYNWDDRQSIDSRDCQRFATIDTAGTSRDKAEEARGKSASWSVCGIWDYYRKADILFAKHVWRKRVAWNELVAEIPEVLHAQGVRRVRIENAHYGPVLAEELRKRGFQVELVGPMLPGMADGYRGAKLERAIASGLLARLEVGKLKLPHPDIAPPWLSAYESELTSWSGSAEETTDQIDASSYAAWECKQGGTQNWGGLIK